MIIVQFIIIQTIVFGIVIFFLRKMTVGDTESAVNRLNKSYEDINKKKEEMVKRIQGLEQEYQKKKEEAEKVAVQVRDQAEEEMVVKKDDALKKARDEAERIVSDAISMKDKIKEDLRKEERMNLVDYCRDILRLTLKDYVKEKINRALIEDFLKELEGMDMTSIPPGVNRIELVSSEKLLEGEKSKIVEIIKKKLKRDLEFIEAVDEKLIGGMLIKFGSLTLDSSIAGKINEHATDKKHSIEIGT